MSNVILHGLGPSTYCRTAMAALAVKGVDYTLEPVAFRSDAHAALHPFHRIPALTHGDVHLYEALAITSYVDRAFEGPALSPEDAAEHAQMLQWISIANDYVYEHLVRSCVAERFVKAMRGIPADEAKIAAASAPRQQVIGVLEAGLEGKVWFTGADISLADMFLLPILAYFEKTPEGAAEMASAPRLQAWLKAGLAHPAVGPICKVG